MIKKVLDLIEAAKAHVRAKVEHPFRIIKCQFGFRKVFYRGIRKSDLKLKMLDEEASTLKPRCQGPLMSNG